MSRGKKRSRRKDVGKRRDVPALKFCIDGVDVTMSFTDFLFQKNGWDVKKDFTFSIDWGSDKIVESESEWVDV